MDDSKYLEEKEILISEGTILNKVSVKKLTVFINISFFFQIVGEVFFKINLLIVECDLIFLKNKI
jgi:hypothetical protein